MSGMLSPGSIVDLTRYLVNWSSAITAAAINGGCFGGGGFFGEDEDDELFSDELVQLNDNKETDGFLDESDSFEEAEENAVLNEEAFAEEVSEKDSYSHPADNAQAEAKNKKEEISDDILDAILGVDSSEKDDEF